MGIREVIRYYLGGEPIPAAETSEKPSDKGPEQLSDKVSLEVSGEVSGEPSPKPSGKPSQELSEKPSGKVLQGTPLERKLGVEFHTIDGVVKAYKSGVDPPLTKLLIAEAFLMWLQDQPDDFAGNKVMARMIDDELYPAFAPSIGSRHSWCAIARHFAKLPGVRRIEIDGGTAYHIPRPRRLPGAAR